MPLFFGSSPEVRIESFDLVVHPLKGIRENDVFMNQEVRVLYQGKRDCLGDNFLAWGIIAFMIRVSNDAANVIVMVNDELWEEGEKTL